MPNTKPSMRHRLYVDLLFDRPVTKTEAKYHARHALTKLPSMEGHKISAHDGPIPRVCVEDVIMIQRRKDEEE